MRKILLPALVALATSTTALGQVSSDDPIYQTTPSSTTPVTYTAFENANPLQQKALTGNGAVICDSGAVTLVGTGGYGYMWSSDAVFSDTLAIDDSLTTGMLYGDTTYYLSAYEESNIIDSLMPLPAHGSNFSGNVRGYYFTAPVDFVITGLRAPTEASTGAQNVAIIKFDNNTPPPLWSTTTNAFQTLGYWSNYTATDTIPTNIVVLAGEVIGIYGNRDDINSYAGAPYTTTIAGNNVTLTRTGMQYPLSSTAMQDVFSETGGSISRVEMIYSTIESDTIPVSVQHAQSTTNAVSATVCAGDSLMVNGSYYANDSIIVDTLFTTMGCDSIVTTTLSVLAIGSGTDAVSICQGDQALINGNYYTTAGIIVDTLTGVNGCDSIVSTTLTVLSLGSATDSLEICMGDSALINGNYYTTAGVIVDTLVGPNGCDSIVTTNLSVKDCTSITEYTSGLAEVFPNPVNNVLNISFKGTGIGEIRITDALGKVLVNYNGVSGTKQVDMSQYSAGVYYVLVSQDGKSHSYKVIKK